jgi:hypothetical protein
VVVFLVLLCFAAAGTANATESGHHDRKDKATVTLKKRWVIDGKVFAEGDQPAGFTAVLLLSGPGDAGLTPQPSGVTRKGYREDDRVKIDERVRIDDPTCRLTSARVTSENDKKVDKPLPHEAKLDKGDNRFTITNTVKCEARLTLVKQVVNTHGGTAQPTDWTLSATGPVTIAGATGTPSTRRPRSPV